MPTFPAPLAAAIRAVWHVPGRAWNAMVKSASVTVWQRFGGALVVSALVEQLIWIIWKGPWSTDAEAARLEWLGRFAFVLILVLLVCIVALFEFRLNFSASRTGLTANAERDDDEELATRTTSGSVREAVSPPPEVPPEEQVRS